MEQQLRRLVVANFFPAFTPPSSGGEQRYYHLYEHLSRTFDVTLVSASYSDRDEELVEHSPTFREYRVPKHPQCESLHWQLQQEGIGPECSGYVVALAGSLDGAYGARLRGLIREADAVIHECPFTVPYDHEMGVDGIPRIYNAYNVEAALARQMLRGSAGAAASDFIEDLERHLSAHSGLIFATSKDERDAFASNYGVDPAKIVLVPNGFEESAVHAGDRPSGGARKQVVFLGSQHPPNVEALEYIAREIAPAAPELDFEILGSVCGAYAGPRPRNLKLRGFVSAEQKSALLGNCLAAINPLFSGAGTNLKMLDYLAHGAAVVSTAIGARGLDLVNGEHAIVVAAEEFPGELRRLVTRPELRADLGRRAAKLAHENYSWRSIAGGASEEIDRLLDGGGRPPRRRIVSLCDYAVHAPSGGGQVRVNRLLRELGREFDVALLCLTDESSPSEHLLAPGVVQRCFPKTQDHREEERRLAAGEWISVADLVSARHCRRNEGLVRAFESELEHADLVLFEQCFLAPLLDLVPTGKKVVYSSQNHESLLKAALLANRRDGESLLPEVEEGERRMLDAADLVVCVSEADAASFANERSPLAMAVVENGVSVPRLHDRPEEYAFGRPLAVFIGSGHPPNIHAARFIAGKIAPLTPDVIYGIVGSVCDALTPDSLPPNVLLMGFLADEEKAALLQLADLAVNPLFEGGGSSLKVPDYFAAGLPTVSSEVGMRGYDATDGVHYLAADPEHFAAAVSRLTTDATLRATMGGQAHRFVRQNFDWTILGGKLRRALRGLLVAPGQRKRALVLTYRFSDPPRGGAEAFLSNVLERICRQGRWSVTVAATAVGAIHNHLQFSAIYETPSSVDRIPPWARDVHLFSVDPDSASLEGCRRLHQLWMDEGRRIGRMFLHALPEAALAGGWNYPECTAKGEPARWSSGRSQFRVPRGSDRVRVHLHAPHRTRIELWQDEVRLCSVDAEGLQVLEASVSGDGSLLQLATSAAYQASGDPRELGVLVTAIEYSVRGDAARIDLRHELERLPQLLPLDAWLGALAEITDSRAPGVDQLFLEQRGPHSSGLRRWLESAVADYDVVLTQGVPFATSELGVHVARRAGVPVIVLPHAHIDDRYYHWQCFYDAYRGADRVIAAPDISVPAFFDRIGARATAFPGGGVAPEEFTPTQLERARKAFAEVHAGGPFMLVLGRKADGKNYQAALDAHAALRAAGIALEMVMIGPDDDGRPVIGKGVSYLGPQPRDVVIGALAEACCLVNMSQSESFGIVLLEAWLAGTPVVANGACAAFRDLVADGIDGLLVTSSIELQQAIRTYVHNPSLAQAHAGQGRSKALRFSWDSLAQSIEGLLSAVASETRGR